MTLLYDDDYCTITSKTITIKCYNLPLGSSYEIPLADVVSVEVLKDIPWYAMSTWGAALPFSKTFWARDFKRAFKNSGIVLTVKGSFFRPGFSPEPDHLEEIYQLIHDNILL